MDRTRLVSRPRLIERLNAGPRSGRKLTLISAPAGFGKTTLLSEWAAGCRRPVAWLSLDKGDNDPTRFWVYFIAALQTIHEGIGETASKTLQSPQPPPLESVLTTMINEIAAVPGNLALVLDDYHLIAAQPIHEALAFLLDHLPGNMHLVLGTRFDPPLPIARLRGRGQLTELRQSDLRFTHNEVAEFLNRGMGLKLAADDVATLASRTEGWIAGLQMAAVSMQGWDAKRVASFIQAFTGSHRHILDYLVEEVLQRQSDEIQTFLLQTVILDRLTGPLCDAVVVEFGDNLQSQTILEYLESSNLFIVPLDDERRWYRYHRLFADLLRKRLHQIHADQVPTLHRRASEWYERNGLIGEAVEHALSAEDFERAAHLIEGVAEATVMRSEIATFLSWVEAVPDDMVRARPLLCVFHAGALLLSGRPLDAVESRLQDATEGDTAGQFAGEAAAFRALIATLQGDARHSTELSQRALELLPEESLFLRSIVADNLGMAHVLSGNVAAAIQAFDEAARTGQKAGNVMFAVAALCNLAGLCVSKGQLHRAAEIYQRALELATDEQGRPLPIAGKALLGLGELSREWNDLEAATRYLTQGVELTWQYGEIGALVCYLSLARVRQAQGDVDGARDAIQKAQQIAIKVDATEMDDILVAACQTRLWIAQGNVEAAMRWVEERGLALSALPARSPSDAKGLEQDVGSGASDGQGSGASSFFGLREIEHITLVRVYIAQGRPDEALEVLKPLLGIAERLEQTRRVIEILILQASALQVRGDAEDALAVLKRALSLAEPEGYVRVFADEGEPMARLLYEAASRGVAPEYAGRLLAAFSVSERGSMGVTPPPPPHTQPLVEALSARELEVLQLIAEGLSNREIAGRLVISLSTVKGHTANIYGKLAVNSRTQAVAKARVLGILPDL